MARYATARASLGGVVVGRAKSGYSYALSESRVFMSSVSSGSLSLAARDNLVEIESVLRRQWRLGQNISLCWSLSPRGILVLCVPHYFFGSFCAEQDQEAPGHLSDNERFVRALISHGRRYERAELFEIADRLGVAPTFIKPRTPLEDEPALCAALDELVKRYGLSFVHQRAVVLFDICGFSLFTSFEQASQLNSLSYSLNSAYTKLQAVGIDVAFRRTTTGDGYYVWHENPAADANRDLFLFLLLVIADNAAAQRAARANTVPIVRAGFHIDAHYELYQAEGINPTLFSYIVGEVTITLARLIEKAAPGQIVIGDFRAVTDLGLLNPDSFIDDAHEYAKALEGIILAGKPIERVDLYLTADTAGNSVGLSVTDKHNLTHTAFNLQFNLTAGDDEYRLGSELLHV